MWMLWKIRRCLDFKAVLKINWVILNIDIKIIYK